MSRLPPQTQSQLGDDAQREFYDFMDGFSKKYFAKSAFTLRTPQGAFLGPYAPLLYTPKLGRAFFDVLALTAALPGLTLKAREVAILVVGTKYQAAYELYAHRRNAVKEGGVTQEECDAICETKFSDISWGVRGFDEKPESLDEKSSMAYDVAKELTDCPGPLSDSTWNSAVQVLGTEGMIALIHFVGGYSHVSILLNGFDCKIPEGESILEYQGKRRR